MTNVRPYLASRFGGYTSVSGKNGYALKSGCVVDEDVAMVTAFAELKQALQFKEDLLENQIAKIINHISNIISPVFEPFYHPQNIQSCTGKEFQFPPHQKRS
jgi:hypothetical protein